MENRSFDQMLGYLELDEFGGHDVDGLKREGDEPPLFNEYAGKRYKPYPLERTALTAAEDLCHDGWCVAEQLSNGNGGFIENFAATHPAVAEPWVVMGYYTPKEVPVYDYLAKRFCVCDRWFSSVPGATWPNRLYAAAGAAAGSLDNKTPPLYNCRSFLRKLDEASCANGGISPPGVGTPAIPPRCD